jgi:hypothetical protein
MERIEFWFLGGIQTRAPLEISKNIHGYGQITCVRCR